MNLMPNLICTGSDPNTGLNGIKSGNYFELFLYAEQIKKLNSFI